MLGSNSPQPAVPPICRFTRQVFADPFCTDHDLKIVVAHAKECTACTKWMGRELNERAKRTRRANASGT
jgi:hypothetical protein